MSLLPRGIKSKEKSWEEEKASVFLALLLMEKNFNLQKRLKILGQPNLNHQFFAEVLIHMYWKAKKTAVLLS